MSPTMADVGLVPDRPTTTFARVEETLRGAGFCRLCGLGFAAFLAGAGLVLFVVFTIYLSIYYPRATHP